MHIVEEKMRPKSCTTFGKKKENGKEILLPDAKVYDRSVLKVVLKHEDPLLRWPSQKEPAFMLFCNCLFDFKHSSLLDMYTDVVVDIGRDFAEIFE